MTERDEPWLMRTYSGHSTAAASNALYRTNLAKGQTGLSIAFDLPTQTGYDPDSPMARGEVGKVGVPIAHLGNMRTLLNGIPPAEMNTSMTINATAPWLLALYVANAEEQGTPATELRGTTQNDIVKEYLSRGTYIFPPEPSRRLIVDMIAWCAEQAPRWNPMNVCSYHLQEAGATPVQELAFSLATAVDVLDAVRASRQVDADRFADVFASISFFVNAGIRFVEEVCKLRAFSELWERIGRTRYGVDDAKALRFRYGVQVNSLGLTEAQPENNVARIVLEMLGVTLSKRARARSVQLPAWNEALGLPRPWDQQWSLRMQQVLAFESDLLEYDDVFDGSVVVETRTAELVDAAWAELEAIARGRGCLRPDRRLEGPARGVDGRTHAAHRDRATRSSSASTGSPRASRHRSVARARSCASTPTSPPPPIADVRGVAGMPRQGHGHRRARRAAAGRGRRRQRDAGHLALAHAGAPPANGAQRCARCSASTAAPPASARPAAGSGPRLQAVADRVRALPGGPPRLLVAKPGLDGHSNGAEQIAVAARDAGHGGRLRRHPDRRSSRSPPPHATRTPTSSDSRSCRAPTSSWCRTS